MTKLTPEHYEKLDKERRKSGLFKSPEPYTPLPFDIDLLRLMPDEGAMKGRYMPDFIKVPQIKRALDPALTSSFVTTRLRVMKDEGLVIRDGTHAKSAGGWQRTAKGRELATRDTIAADDKP